MTKASIVGFVESGQRLIKSQEFEWNPHDLLATSERAELRNTGWPIGLVLKGSGHQPVPTPDGIEARLGRYASGQTEDYWYFRKDGSYYVSRLYEEDYETLQWTSSAGHPECSLWFDIRIWRIAEILLHSAAIYRELNIPPEESYHLAINHKGLEGREFYVSDPRRHVLRGRICHAAAATWMREVTQDYVTSNLKTLVGEVSNNLFVLFDFASINQEVIDSIVDEFLSRKL